MGVKIEGMKNIIEIEIYDEFHSMRQLWRVYIFGFFVYRTYLLAEDKILDSLPRDIRFLKWLFQRLCKHNFRKQGGHWITGYVGDGVSYSQKFRCHCGKEEVRNYTCDVFAPQTETNRLPSTI